MGFYTDECRARLKQAIAEKGCLSIGLTGGIATGKSNITSLLRAKGYTVSDNDATSHYVMENDSALRDELVSAFGTGILGADGKVNRKALGALVFGESEAREKLNGIMHPAILRVWQEELTDAFDKGEKLVFTDMPLLYEIGYETRFDAVWVVWVPEGEQLRRLMERDGSTEEAARARMSSQLPVELKRDKADAAICSIGTFEETQALLGQLLDETLGLFA